jgi:hypothetical protein
MSQEQRFEEPASSIFRVDNFPENGDGRFHRNVGTYLATARRRIPEYNNLQLPLFIFSRVTVNDYPAVYYASVCNIMILFSLIKETNKMRSGHVIP